MENTFDLKKFLVENRLTANSKILTEQEQLDEGILTWIKDKAVGFAKKINQLKGDGLMSLFTKILPADLVNFVKSKAAAYKPKPEVVKEYRTINYINLLERRNKDDDKVQYRVKYLNPQFKPEEEVNKMSDQEYQAYLQQIADNTVFPIDFEGEMRDSSEMALYRFFKSKGLRITTELVTDAKPTLNDIQRKIGTIPGLSRTKKKLYIYGSYVLFFGLVIAKIATMLPGLHEEDDTQI